MTFSKGAVALSPFRNRRSLFSRVVVIGIGLAVVQAAQAAPVGGHTLKNPQLTARFEDGSLRAIEDARGVRLDIAEQPVAISVAGEKLTVPGLELASSSAGDESVTYTYKAGDRRLQVVYELKPGWHFVSKHLVLTLPDGAAARIDQVEAFRAELKPPVAREHVAAHMTGAVFLRFEGSAAQGGAFLALQNPFLKWERSGSRVAMSYPPEMEWRADYGPFATDRVCIGVYPLTGIESPARGVREWEYLRSPQEAFSGKPVLDGAESDAMIRCVEAFAKFRLDRSVKVHVPWCENDYQIDVGTPAGRSEYKRIIDQVAALGCDHTLFTPGNSAVSRLEDNADAWGWENVLWLGLGQKIRKGEWNIASDPMPPSVQELLDYAKARNVKFVAYAYPTLGWKQNPEWTAWCGGKTGGYVGVDTGVRSFQDWFVDQLVAFQKRTGVSGYSFDHWWIAYTPEEDKKPTSKYAQWYGCRRILEELRRRIPDVVIDGRQQYQWFGPWTWLGGSYPHPTTSDEQPGSFENFPDLHFSRVSGDRQRWAAWWYRLEQFTPLDLLPGYMTHQTPRNDAEGRCVRDRPFRTRDWDLLGWKYSVISSIGTAPFNHVVDLVPARDETEFAHFRPEDQQWWRGWMEWTDRNMATLRHLRPIIGPPVLGRVDGTAAIDGDRGFVFLFNPNYRRLSAEFTLDASIGLTRGDGFVLRELYPREGFLHGHPKTGTWKLGDRVSLSIKGPQAMVLELIPAAGLERPLLLNATGRARLSGDALTLSDVAGEPGTGAELLVLLPAGTTPARLTVNGANAPSPRQEGDVLTLPVKFAGTRFDHCHQAGEYDPGFSETVYRARFSIPQRVFAQLAERRKAWPVPYTADDLLATWLGSDRLLFFVQIADPDDKWSVGLKLNGQPVELRKAYSDVYPLGRERTFTGFYADLSALKPDTPYEAEVQLPEKRQPGQFQGLFFENVEAEWTTELVP